MDLAPTQTLRVDTTARQSPLKSLNFASLRIKDAVCDALREATGTRPDVDTHAPDLSLLLHLDTETALLYVDLSGEALFKRGWRERARPEGRSAAEGDRWPPRCCLLPVGTAAQKTARCSTPAAALARS